MKLNLLNIAGGKAETIDISDKIMKLKFNHKLIKYVVDWQLNHRKLNKEMKSEDLPRKFTPKKELVKQDTQVKKHHYLLEVVRLMDQKELFIK
jgi:ribosomal protein L4